MNEEMTPLKRALVALEEMEERLETMRRAATQPMAIVGAACRFPEADTLEAYWNNLEQGRNSVREIDPSRWDVSRYYDPNPDAPGKVSTRWGGFLESVDKFDADFFGISPREAEYIDPQHRIFLEVAWEAIERARLTRAALAGTATGVFAAVCFHDYDRMMVQNFEDIVAYTITGGAPSMLANRLSYLLDLRGPSLTVDTACSSSLVAVHLACQSLRAGNCDIALVGGVNLLLDPATTIAASKFRMMSPVGRCKTFDASADGFVRGEGCGVIVLKRLDDAEADGDEVLAIIRGTAVNQDGRTNGLTAPNGRAQEQVIRAALRDGGVEPTQVGYVETHGTGTALGDPIEVEALMRVYDRGRAPGATCQLGAVKTNIGHLEASAGMAGLIKAALALRHGRVPGNLHFETLNPEIDLERSCFRFPTGSVDWPQWPRFASASSFGFGGTNAHIVMEAAPLRASSTPKSPLHAQAPMLVPISARREVALHALARLHLEGLAQSSAPALQELASELSTARTHMEHRFVAVAESAAELEQQLASFLAGEPRRGVFSGQANAEADSVVFVFPGQGSQWFGMGRELFEHDAVFRESMEACSAAIERETGWALLDELSASVEQSRMAEIDFIQPLLFAISVSLAAVWRARGIEPDMVVGHSMGEVAAAYVAGGLSLADAARVICCRSRLMRRLRGKGQMAVTELTMEQAAVVLEGYQQRVSIAASNGPRSTVLSGEPAALTEILAQLERKDIFCRLIEVDVASHSPGMDELRSELLEALRDLRPQSCSVPMFSTVLGSTLEGGELSGQYWFDNLREPVLFYPVVHQLLAEGPTALVECSPHPVLLPAVHEVVGAGGALAVASLRRNESERRMMLESLATLHIRGAEVDWTHLYTARPTTHVPLPTYPWQREAFWFSSTTGSQGARPPQQHAQSPEGWLQTADDATTHVRQLATPDAAPRGTAAASREVCTPPPTQHPPVPAHRLRSALLALPSPEARRELLELSIRQHVARVLKSAPERLERERRLELDSLMAMQVKVSLQAELGTEVPLAILLRGATPRSLATHLLADMDARDEAVWLSAALPTIEPRPELRNEPFELTDLQQAYWLGRGGAFEMGGVATYFYVEVDIDELDVGRLSEAWNKLVARHPMLRAEFHADGRQRVRAEVPFYTIESADLRGSPDQERTLAELREERSQRVFAGDAWPLFEIKASRLDATFTRLHIGLDILIVDGWAISTLFREWRTLYRELDATLPRLDVDFRDYVVLGETIRQGADYQHALAYWKERAKLLPEAPKLPLRGERARGAAAPFVHRTALLEADKWAGFQERARLAGVTPSTAIGAAYSEILAAWSADRHFTLNLLFFNRLPLHEQIEEVVGNFSTTMLLEVDIREPATFADNALKIQDALTESLDHSLVNGVEVLREVNRHRGWSGDAAMPVVFASALDTGAGASAKRLDVAVNLKGLGTDSRMVGSSLRTPQVYLDHQIYEENGELRLNWDSLDALLPDGLFDVMWSAYLTLLDKLATDTTAWSSVARIGMTPASDLLDRTRANSKRAAASSSLLHAGFFEQAQRSPQAPAIITSELTLSYETLEARATSLAHRLLELQVRTGELVAIFCRKGWEQVVAVLAIQAAGAGYLPIDPALPDQRVKWLLADGEVRVVLGSAEELARVASPNLVTVPITDDTPSVTHEMGKQLAAQQRPEALAYVIYTSGSTGCPKGVAISHRAALNTVEHVNRMFEVGPRGRSFAISSLSFDLSVYDLFGPLSVGGAVVIPGPDQLRSPAEWLRLIESSGATMWNSVPALVELLVECCESLRRDLPDSLKLIMMSGDWIPVTLADRIRKRSHGVKIVSLGGATEASIWSIAHTIDGALPGWSSVPYGYPLPNQQFHVLDTHLEPCPTHVSGELFIGGEGLAMHYWRDPKRTAERFIVHATTGERLYRTGDLGRYRSDGIIEFQGRNDLQVKVQGYRIELGEVEAVIESHPAVRACVAVVKGDRAEAKTLVGYWVANEQGKADAADLQTHVASRLPSYMVPTLWVQLPALPLSANGKVDRSALPDPLLSEQARTPRVHVAPRNEVESQLHELWSSLLSVKSFGVTDQFFDLGGQSLLAMRLTNRINERFSRSYPVSLLFGAGTIEKLARHIESDTATGWSPLAALRSTGSLAPFFCVHPVGGNVLCYRGLADEMPAERPFFGLQARGLVRGLAPHATIEDAARDYISAVRAAQPHGPYYLGGWSLGGVIAFEMAQQLRAAGQEVGHVVMLDSRLPGGAERDALALLRDFAADMARLRSVRVELDEEELLAGDDRQRFTHVIDALKSAAALPVDVEASELEALWRTYRVSLRALDRYRPSLYEGRVSIFAAETQPENACRESGMGWEALVANTLSASVVKGDHYGILEPQNWHELAARVEAALRS